MVRKEPSPPQTIEADQDEVTQSYAMAKRLLPFLAKRGIPASPENYHIFYDYLLRSNPVLNKTVNDLLHQNATFYHQLSASLYQYFYSAVALESQTQAINDAAHNFMAVSTAMEDNLQTAQNRTDHFQKMLTDTSRQMTQIAATDEIQPILETLIRETEAALADHGKFSGQLSAANKTIAQLQAELNTQSNLARIDELTQLYNRRHLHREAPGILRQAARTGKPLSAIMFDLDRFKRINDTWGHNFGDKVLAQCAAIIKRAARPDDLAVRLGGEEFLLLCPNDPLDQAVETAENIRLEIASTDMTVRGNSLFVTISGGVAQYVVGEGMQEFLGRADQALYQAKNDGRNRICRTTERSDEVASFNPLPIPPGSH